MKALFALVLLSLLLTACPACPKTEKLISFEDKVTGLYGFKNAKQEIVIPAQFQSVSEPKADDSLIEVVKENKFYRMDKKGKLAFESFFYDNAWDYYEEGLARFVLNGKIGFHDAKGHVVIQANYDFAMPFENGSSAVCIGCTSYIPEGEEHSEMKGGKWGVIDLKGKLVIPIESESQSDALAKLKKSN